jgi:hypothetical protein
MVMICITCGCETRNWSACALHYFTVEHVETQANSLADFIRDTFYQTGPLADPDPLVVPNQPQVRRFARGQRQPTVHICVNQAPRLRNSGHTGHTAPAMSPKRSHVTQTQRRDTRALYDRTMGSHLCHRS